MSVDTLVIAPTRLPRVNLLPQEINEAAKARQVKVMLAAAVMATVAGMGYLTMSAGSSVNDAQGQYDAAQTKTRGMQTELAKHTGITAVKADVVQRETLLATAMGQNVKWANFLNDVRIAIPRGVRFESWTTTVTPLSTTPSAVGGAFGTNGTASWVFTGQAKSYEDIAKLIEALYKMKSVDSAYATSAKSGLDGPSRKSVYTFSLQARVSQDAVAPYKPKAGR